MNKNQTKTVASIVYNEENPEEYLLIMPPDFVEGYTYKDYYSMGFRLSNNMPIQPDKSIEVQRWESVLATNKQNLIDKPDESGKWQGLIKIAIENLELLRGGSIKNTVPIESIYKDKFGQPMVDTAAMFLEQSGKLMTDLAHLCKSYGINDAKNIFCFTLSGGQYDLFVDYEALLMALKKDKVDAKTQTFFMAEAKNMDDFSNELEPITISLNRLLKKYNLNKDVIIFDWRDGEVTPLISCELFPDSRN